MRLRVRLRLATRARRNADSDTHTEQPLMNRQRKLPRTIRLIGVPLDLGASRRGVDMGPSALRIAGLQSMLLGLGCTVHDMGNVSVPQRETLGHEGKWSDELEAMERNLRGARRDRAGVHRSARSDALARRTKSPNHVTGDGHL